ncbi:MAG: peptidylprolyl isomerase [Spirochaetota bacterium]
MKTDFKKWAALVAAFVFIASLGLFSFAFANRKPVDEEDKGTESAIAVVNGEEISRDYFEMRVDIVQKGMSQQGQVPDEAQMNEIKTQTLENLIDSELLYQESQKRGISVESEKVSEQFEAITSKFSSEEEFQSAIKEMGYTEQSLKEDIKREIAITNLIEQEIQKDITVKEEELKQFYEENSQYFQEPEQVQASHILIAVDDPSDTKQKEQALQKITEVEQKLEAGEEFKALAKEYSEGPSASKGGNLGFFKRGEMDKSFEEAAFSLKPGQTSGIVETRFGYHLIKVTDRKPAGSIPYENVKDRISQYIEQEKVRKEIDKFLEKARDEAAIEKYLKEAEAE